jgi:hypothetical protein
MSLRASATRSERAAWKVGGVRERERERESMRFKESKRERESLHAGAQRVAKSTLKATLEGAVADLWEVYQQVRFPA